MGALRSEGAQDGEPVALETAVVATGARPGGSSAKRELFTEETQTVLVFEKGAVIRLAAAVADGQLLFLTNKKTGKEVVTQVIRKRSFRPTSCYVDLEFTEACPGFWGIEFAKSVPRSPGDAKRSEDSPANATAAAAAAPDQQEVERLKREVAELQTQLKSLIDPAPAREPSAAMPISPEARPTEDATRKRLEESRLEQLLKQEDEQEKLHGPRRLVAYPKKDSGSPAKRKAGKIATVGALALVVTAGGVAAYRFGLLGRWLGKATPAKFTAPATAFGGPEAESRPNRQTAVQPGSLTPGTAADPQTSSTSSRVAESKIATGDAAENANSSMRTAPTPRSVVAGDSKNALAKDVTAGIAASRESNAKKTMAGEAARVPPAKPTDSNAAANSDVAPTAEEFIAPKLIRAVKPGSPPEALRNYLTGNVNVEALVDSKGHVKSVTVVSGPEKLRKSAVELMMQYIYEPARKNGKAVPARVQESLQFWYAP